jgi:hypothetical protein
MTEISDYLSVLKHSGLCRLRELELMARSALGRARAARMSPFDVASLGALASGAAGAGGYFLICAFAPAVGAVAGNEDWRSPIDARPEQRRAETTSRPDTDTLTRPLFEKSRRPVVKTASERPTRADAAQVETPPVGMSLKGIVNHGADTRIFVVTTALAEGVWLQIGEELEGWTVERVERSDVTLRRGGRVAHLDFQYAEAPSVGAGAAVFVPPAPPPPPRPLRPRR